MSVVRATIGDVTVGYVLGGGGVRGAKSRTHLNDPGRCPWTSRIAENEAAVIEGRVAPG